MARKRKSIVKRRAGSPFWWYDWTVAGRRFRGSCETDDEESAVGYALKVRDRLHRQIRLGENPATDITLNAAATRLWTEHWAGLATGGDNLHHMRPVLRIVGRDTRLADITDQTVIDFVARRRGETAKNSDRPVAPATVNHSLIAWSKIMRQAREVWARDKVAPVAVSEINPRRYLIPVSNGREIYLSRDEARALVDALVPHARAPVMLALMTGFRRGNVLGLAWQDLVLDGLAPRAAVVAKGGQAHAVPLIPPAVQLLKRLAPDPANRRGPVFTFGNPAVGCTCWHCTDAERAGAQIKSVKRAFHTARAAIGRPEATFHDLRHTVASWILQANYGLAVVQDTLGHADISTTRRYAHLETGAVAAAMGASLNLELPGHKAQIRHKKKRRPRRVAAK